jgi:hypothetical protein
LAAAVSAGAGPLPLAFTPGSAFAEFEIPEVDVDKGSLEAEYRGASHWGLPPPDADGEVDALRQSHELEIQYGLTDWWALRITPNAEQPEGASLNLATVGIETQFVLVRRDGGDLGLAFMLGYGPFTELVDVDSPDEFELGPVLELAGKGWLASFNPRLAWELGEFAEHDSAGFEYAAQLRVQVARRWALAALGFGEIENLADAGGVDEQVHLFGPGLYLFSRDGAGSGIEAGRWAEAEGAEAGLQWSLGAGLLFGLTEASDDTTLRVTFAVER